MHKLILWIFRNLDNIAEIFAIACAFLIIATTLCWLENIFQTTWGWLNVIKPVLNIFIDFSNNTIPLSIKTGDTTIDMKYALAIAILLVLLMMAKFIVEKIADLREVYNDLHFKSKLKKERTFNKNLVQKIEKEQKGIEKYVVMINTQLQKKFLHKEISINIDEQNKLMNEFITRKTSCQPELRDGGFLYYFDDFNKIDDILDIMFKLIKSNSPLEYAICIQIGGELSSQIMQLEKLVELKIYGKITCAADTLLRYKYNKSHRYGTQSLGIYQKGEGTIEVHDFHEIL